jgi:hypothetical protein
VGDTIIFCNVKKLRVVELKLGGISTFKGQHSKLINYHTNSNNLPNVVHHGGYLCKFIKCCYNLRYPIMAPVATEVMLIFG